MMKSIVKWLIVLGLLLVPAQAQAAITIVNTAPVTFNSNDPTVTFAGNFTYGNHVVIFFFLSNGTDTASVSGIAGNPTVNTLAANTFATTARRWYALCFAVNATGATDNAFLITTSASATANGFAVELNQGSCNLDDSSFNDESSSSNHELDIGLQVGTCGSIVFGLVQSTNTADFSAGNLYTGIPASNTDFASNTMLGEYIITTSTGTYDTPFTNTAEISTIAGIAVEPASACGGGGGGSRQPRNLLRGGTWVI